MLASVLKSEQAVKFLRFLTNFYGRLRGALDLLFRFKIKQLNFEN